MSSTTADMAGTWPRKIDGRIHHMVVKKLVGLTTTDWLTGLQLLAKNLEANSLRPVDDLVLLCERL
jgi:hypothetical protein